jgi:hypothetical protein
MQLTLVKPTQTSNFTLLITCRGKSLADFNDLGGKRDLSGHYIKTVSLSTNLYARYLNIILNIAGEHKDMVPSQTPFVIPVHETGAPECFIPQLLKCSEQV